jgi:symplekin
MLAYSSNKDRSFSQFIVDLPEIPLDEIARLGEMCLKPEQ